ncbi:MAG: hypothetical protein HYU66_27800 [Armatimonadetes bacterium]|nr:hypothetical protein [Armatimonadota bacterium]
MAGILAQLGIQVSGSEIARSSVLDRLQHRGIACSIGHSGPSPTSARCASGNRRCTAGHAVRRWMSPFCSTRRPIVKTSGTPSGTPSTSRPPSAGCCSSAATSIPLAITSILRGGSPAATAASRSPSDTAMIASHQRAASRSKPTTIRRSRPRHSGDWKRKALAV